jgi:hypothetical protein
MEQVIKRAKQWWESKRPLEWSEKEHAENPMVNCPTEQEKKLAIAVRDYLGKNK